MRLTGKTALIPGGSRPVGRAISRKLASEGANLILPFFDWPDSSREMIEEFRERKIDFLALHLDLTKQDDVTALVAEIKSKFGSLHYLVNNIERGGMPVVHGSYDHDHNRDQWDLEFNTTLKAKWLLFHHTLPLLRQAEQAAVVNISSIAAITARSGAAELFFSDGYSAANRGISSLTETWAREGAPNIRVNELMLGLVKNRHGEGTRGWSTLSEIEKKRILDHILLKRTALPEEVADAVFFLLHEASYMTGSVVKMDGGYTIGGDTTTNIPSGIL